MPKKKPAESLTPDTAASSAQRRGRAPAKRAAEPPQPPSIANDREAMPEPAAQRVTAADATEADSITFTSLAGKQPTYDEIAEAAYRRYLSRGGSHGQDFEDWIAAEQELKIR